MTTSPESSQTTNDQTPAPEAFAEMLKNACKQLSQLNAWVWLDQPILGDKGVTRDAEIGLKEKFNEALETLRDKPLDEEEKRKAIGALKNLLVDSESELTLRQVYILLTNNDDYAFSVDYLEVFSLIKVVNALSGNAEFLFSIPPKFSVTIAYPDEPNSELTQDVLKRWATNADPNRYEPLSDKIPFCGSC